MFILLKAIYRFSVIFIKIPMAFFIEIENKNPNMYKITKYLEWPNKP